MSRSSGTISKRLPRGHEARTHHRRFHLARQPADHGVTGAGHRHHGRGCRIRYLAAATTRVELLALVTAAAYREPGLLAKIVTTLDVPTSERFERLEKTLRICLQMWSGGELPGGRLRL
jgi:hypothetical protein